MCTVAASFLGDMGLVSGIGCHPLGTISRSKIVATCSFPKSTMSFLPSVVSNTARTFASVGMPLIFAICARRLCTCGEYNWRSNFTLRSILPRFRKGHISKRRRRWINWRRLHNKFDQINIDLWIGNKRFEFGAN
jgi:hypothetical protein